MKKVVKPLIKRANNIYLSHFTGVHIVPTTYEETTFWNEAFNKELNLLTPDEKQLVIAYIEIQRRED